MTCSRERLSHYHDDELSAEESAEVRAHILECQTCSAELEFYRWVRQQIRQSAERRAPNTLRRDVFQRVDATRRERARWGGLGAFGPAVPMAVAAMLVADWWGSGSFCRPGPRR
ncbi:MAG: zf-HC2 domain-containing protein [Chloroflexi bacterium]|nr:zf-HC2 domain-containing protein [Chloroflexota bacterium]